IAPMRAARITSASTLSGRTMPLPMVRATFTPNPNAATKLKNAAQTTACVGLRTRVDTTVAIELAASWNPLMKSKSSATTTMKTTSVSGSMPAGLAHLQHDALDDVHDVLTPVGDLLEVLVDLLPLDHLDGVGHVREQGGDELLQESIRLVLETVHLDAVPVIDLARRAEARHGRPG